ncbi:MAG: hypothetical protein M3065_00975, partial [Actinomycetota bacterium]|nr:hypothetical protein [Actinomycetota bacterium]
MRRCTRIYQVRTAGGGKTAQVFAAVRDVISGRSAWAPSNLSELDQRSRPRVPRPKMHRLRPRYVLLTVTVLFASAIPAASSAASVTCFGKRATIVGTQSADRLVGGDGSDIISGLGGNDRIFGGDGPDLICGDDGRDVIYGGRGDDVILGGFDGLPDRIYGGPGSDYLSGDGRLYGGSGDDALFTNYGDTVHDRLDGGPGNDRLTSHSANPVTLIGAAGDDILRGRAGHDHLEGGPGDDRLFARGAANVLRGGPGDDVIHASSSSDRIDCGSGQ